MPVLAAHADADYGVEGQGSVIANGSSGGAGKGGAKHASSIGDATPSYFPPPPSAPQKKVAVRHAEKDRLSTCSFADQVARATIEEYNRRRPKEWKHQQTVLAGILACRTRRSCSGDASASADSDGAVVQAEPGTLFVVAFGVGTKFLDGDACSRTSQPLQGARDPCGVDMHAEVLARRGLLRFLQEDLLRCQGGAPCGELLEPCGGTSGGYRLRDDTTLHLYTSSVPCGNASWKRWAKGGGAPASGAPLDAWPVQRHGRITMHARSEGQVCFLLKHAGLRASDDSSAAISSGQGSQPADGSGQATRWPVGTDVFDCCWAAKTGRSPLTCSDKIAQWNALGMQGASLSQVLDAPVRISTCTIGRKFSFAHCARALCCRLQDFTPLRIKGLHPRFGIVHPALLGSGVKLDDGVYEGDAGASFVEHRCLVWVRGDEVAEVLDGHTGRSASGGVSCVAPCALADLAGRLAGQEREGAVATQCGMGAEAYREAKALLQKHVSEKCTCTPLIFR